jgi:hypothetical protein
MYELGLALLINLKMLTPSKTSISPPHVAEESSNLSPFQSGVKSFCQDGQNSKVGTK